MKRLVPFVIATLLFTSCQSSTILTTLDATVAAAEVAIPVIGATTGLSSQTQTVIVEYLQAVLAGSSQASTILAGPGTSQEKSVMILNAFSKITAGIVLPPGTPGAVQAVVVGVMQAVAIFLANIQPSGPVAVPVLAKTKLTAIRTRAESASGRLRAIKR